jgi:site-specific DNA-methyltransferase (adenine-specific)
MEHNKIYHMDAVELLNRLPDDSIDMILTSPPYDNLRTYSDGYTFDFEAIAEQSYRVLKPGGVLVWVVGDATINGSETLTSMRQALYFVDTVGFKMHDTMIYEQNGTGAKGSNKAYWQAWEYMFILVKGSIKTVNRIKDVKNKTIGLRREGRWRKNGNKEKPHHTSKIGTRTNIWRYRVGFMDKSDKTIHPAPFPEKLAKDHILTWTNPGDLVLDYFMGSGTTAKMARATERNYIGCDISEEYVTLANNRLKKPYTPNMFILQEKEQS